MITFNLPQLALMGHPTWATLTTDNHIATPGALGEFELNFQATPADGDTFTWTWSDGAVALQFTFLDSPGESATELRSGTGGLSVYDWISSRLIPDLEAFQYLAQFFSFQAPGGGVLSITTVEKDSRFDSSFSFSGAFAQAQTNTTPITEERASNMRFATRYRLQPAGGTMQELELSLNPSGPQAYLNLSQFLSREDFPAPTLAPAATAPVNQDEQLVKVWLQAAEQSSNQGQLSTKAQTSAAVYFLPGGISEQDYKTLDLASSIINGSQALLSVLPTTRYLAEDQDHFLTVLNFKSEQDAVCEATLHYQDGTSSTTVLYSVQPLPVFAIRSFPVRWEQLQDQATAGKTLRKATVRIYLSSLGTETDLTPPITLYPDTRVAQEAYDIAYRNSLGFWEVFRCVGERVIAASGQKKYEATSYPITGIDRFTRAALPVERERAQRWELHTGYLRPEQITALQDLLISSDVRLLRGSHYLPVRLEDVDEELTRSRSHLANGLTLTLRELETSKYYSDGQYSF